MILSIWFFVVLAAVLTFIPAPFAKEYYRTKNIIWLFAGVLSLVLLVYVYTFIFKKEDLSVYFPILKIMAALFSVIVGVFIFGEKMTSKKGVGLLFAVTAIYLLSSH